MENKKHIILRKDVASNTMCPKNELIRIVKNKEGKIFVDTTKKANGRGVYLKPNLDSLEKTIKNRSLERGLKTKISDEVYQEIKSEIENNWD